MFTWQFDLKKKGEKKNENKKNWLSYLEWRRLWRCPDDYPTYPRAGYRCTNRWALVAEKVKAQERWREHMKKLAKNRTEVRGTYCYGPSACIRDRSQSRPLKASSNPIRSSYDWHAHLTLIATGKTHRIELVVQANIAVVLVLLSKLEYNGNYYFHAWFGTVETAGMRAPGQRPCIHFASAMKPYSFPIQHHVELSWPPRPCLGELITAAASSKIRSS